MPNQIDILRSALLQNEDTAIKVLANKSATGRSVVYKNFFKSLKRPGDFIWFITLTNSSKSGNEMTEEYHLNGLKTAYDILMQFLPFLDKKDCIDFNNLVIGDSYSIEEISALAKVFYSKGMYFVHDTPSSRKAIVKATFFGGPYADHWIEEPDIMLYHMEKETISAFSTKTYKKECNRAIFNCLQDGTDLPIYCFARGEAKQKFLFCGVFKASGISEDGTCFVLTRTDNAHVVPLNNPKTPIGRALPFSSNSTIVTKSTDAPDEKGMIFHFSDGQRFFSLVFRKTSKNHEFELLKDPTIKDRWVCYSDAVDGRLNEKTKQLVAGLLLAWINKFGDSTQDMTSLIEIIKSF